MRQARANMHVPNELALNLAGWGTAQADLAALAPMRKALPKWVPAGTPGHFLKHADEQTVVAVAALDRAVQSLQASPERYADWSIVAAPQCIGRIAGAASLDRFAKGGGPTVSPHLIPQHSLHSVSGALSILLCSNQPNFGVGGAVDSLPEGLLAALAMPGGSPRGVWFIATSWDPEPVLDDLGNCTNSPCCYAAVLALTRHKASESRGQLRLRLDSGQPEMHVQIWSADAAALCASLESSPRRGIAFGWRLPWGGTIVFEAHAASVPLAAAA